MKNLGKYSPVPWHTKLPSATSTSLDMLQDILRFDPAQRLTAAQCLQHRWLEEHVDPSDPVEQDCTTPFTFDSEFAFEGSSRVNWRDEMWSVVTSFHPEMR
eukprot:COSAG01_NODE_92_length_27199_cov_100.594649_2_plen_101_part_00